MIPVYSGSQSRGIFVRSRPKGNTGWSRLTDYKDIAVIISVFQICKRRPREGEAVA